MPMYVCRGSMYSPVSRSTHQPCAGRRSGLHFSSMYLQKKCSGSDLPSGPSLLHIWDLKTSRLS
eukprot:2290297-Alexandrium_andersonii.AAC.1